MIISSLGIQSIVRIGRALNKDVCQFFESLFQGHCDAAALNNALVALKKMDSGNRQRFAEHLNTHDHS